VERTNSKNSFFSQKEGAMDCLRRVLAILTEKGLAKERALTIQVLKKMREEN